MTKLPFAFVFLLLFPLISGEIETLKLSYDSRPSIFLEQFRFTDTGHITIFVSSASAISAVGSPDLSRFGFFLLPEASSDLVLLVVESKSSLCPLDLNYVDRLFTFRDLNHSSFNLSYTVTTPGEYFLYFWRCVSRPVVSMELRTELYNLDERGVKDFLSPYLARWPVLYFGFSVAYFAVLSFLVCVCVKNRNSVCRIHLLMCVLVLAKALNLSIEAEKMRYVRVTGMTPRGWGVLLYVLRYVGDVMLFAVIALLGAGWSFMKRSLEEKEVVFFILLIPLRVLANVASVMIGEAGPLYDGVFDWYGGFSGMEVICCVAVVASVMSSIVSLEKTPESDGGKAAAKRLAKLALFRQFYAVVVIGYLFLTRIMMLAGVMVIPYKYQWVAYAAVEIANLAFCGILVYMFRPVEKNEYFLLDEAEEQAAEMAIRYEEAEV